MFGRLAEPSRKYNVNILYDLTFITLLCYILNLIYRKKEIHTYNTCYWNLMLNYFCSDKSHVSFYLYMQLYCLLSIIRMEKNLFDVESHLNILQNKIKIQIMLKCKTRKNCVRMKIANSSLISVEPTDQASCLLWLGEIRGIILSKLAQLRCQLCTLKYNIKKYLLKENVKK